MNSINLDLYLSFYKQMYLIRRVEETLLKLFSMGLLSGTIHTCIGQEACAVGIINALDKEKDIIFSNHRCHGHFIAYSNNLYGLFSEIMGKKSGVCGGVGGSQHLSYKNFFSNGIQGGMVPIAAGCAMAEKMKNSGAIVVVFIGDGTLGQGVVYETFNISSLWELPILYVVENNRYAQSTPSYMQHAGKISNRASVFNIECKEINVVDVVQLYFMTKEIVNFIRNNSKPIYFVLHTYRFAPHSKGDDFRPKDEIENYKKYDPLVILRNNLTNYGMALDDIENKIEMEINDCLELAMNSEFMDFIEFSNLIYNKNNKKIKEF